MKLEDLTLIVPTRNEAHNILTFLDSVHPDVQLIVVDASSDDTPDLIEACRPQGTLVLRHPSTVTEARQAGAEAAQTPWLLFSDADVTFAPDYFERLQQLDAPAALYGPKLSRDAYARYHRWFARGQAALQHLGIPAASGSNLLVAREAFHAAGGFDLALTCNEDSELVWRIKRSGYTTNFARDLVVYSHDHRRLVRGATLKTIHTLVRCALLYSNLMPRQWRGHDWGYWSQREPGQ